jgi:hypothetical protein
MNMAMESENIDTYNKEKEEALKESLLEIAKLREEISAHQRLYESTAI